MPPEKPAVRTGLLPGHTAVLLETTQACILPRVCLHDPCHSRPSCSCTLPRTRVVATRTTLLDCYAVSRPCIASSLCISANKHRHVMSFRLA